MSICNCKNRKDDGLTLQELLKKWSTANIMKLLRRQPNYTKMWLDEQEEIRNIKRRMKELERLPLGNALFDSWKGNIQQRAENCRKEKFFETHPQALEAGGVWTNIKEYMDLEDRLNELL